MPTMGAILVVINRCSLVRASMAVQGGRSAHELLYLAAVQDGGHCDSGTEPGDELDLDSDADRQLGQANGCAGMPPGLAEDLDQQIRASVQDRRGLVKAGSHIHHAEDLDDPLDPVEIAKFGLEGSQDRQCRHPRRLAALLQSEITADLATYHQVTRDRTMAAHVYQPLV